MMITRSLTSFENNFHHLLSYEVAEFITIEHFSEQFYLEIKI